VRVARGDGLCGPTPRLEPGDLDVRMADEQAHELATAVPGGADDPNADTLAGHASRILVP
jgi:hypothetical protein